MAKLFAFRLAGKVKKSRAWYRVNATRELTGGTKVGTTAEIKRKVSKTVLRITQIHSVVTIF